MFQVAQIELSEKDEQGRRGERRGLRKMRKEGEEKGVRGRVNEGDGEIPSYPAAGVCSGTPNE